MSRSWVSVAAYITIGMAAGCESTTEPTADLGPAIETEASGFSFSEWAPSGTVLGYRLEIPHVFTNHTRAPVYIKNCIGGFPINLEKRVDGEWAQVYVGGGLLQCLSAPIVVEPGATHSDTLEVGYAFPGTIYSPQMDPAELPGNYRMVWPNVLSSFQSDGPPFGEPIPLEYRVSNEFQLTLD